MSGYIDVSKGPLADHTRELYHRVAFVELFAMLLAAYPDLDSVATEDNMTGFYLVASDLADMALAVNNRAHSEV